VDARSADSIFRQLVDNGVLSLFSEDIPSAHNVEELMNFLEQNPAIRSLHIPYRTDFDSEIVRSLASNKTLEYLHLRAFIDHECVVELAAHNTTLHTLSLSGDGNSTLDKIWIDALDKMTHIETLDLSRITIDPEIANALANKKTIKYLMLYSIKIQNLTVLAGKTTLETLELSHVDIDNNVIHVLATNENITHLQLSGSETEVLDIEELASSKTLKTLKLRDSFYISDNTVGALTRNQNITHLELKVKEWCGTDISKLAGNTTLKTLKLRLWNCKPELMLAFACNQTLVHLEIDILSHYLHPNPITNEYGWVTAFQCNYTLMHVKVFADKMSKEKQAVLDGLSDRNKHFQLGYAKECEQLITGYFPLELAKIVCSYLNSNAPLPVSKGLRDEMLDLEISEKTMSIRLFQSSPEEVCCLHRLSLFHNNAVQRQNFKYKTGGLIVLTVGSTVGIFYLGIAGTAAICIPIVLCVASMYYGFSLYQNHSERGALERAGMASP
jgi:hypothetical protein